VADFVRGINFKPDDVVSVDHPGAVACMRTKNVQAELDCSDVWGVDERFVRRTDQILEKGDLLVSSANSWNLVGKCCWIPDLPWRSTFGGFVSVLRPNRAKVDPTFLYRWFSSTRIQTAVRSFGQQTTNISNLNTDRCLKLPFPLPPLPEQRRIADILDKADALRAKRRAALAQLDTLTQSIYLDMFGDPAMNPRGWTTKPLNGICREITDIDHKMPLATEVGVPFISAKDLTDDGRIAFDDVKRISEDDFRRLSRKSKPEKGDIIYSRIGVNLGKARIVDVDIEFLASYSCCTIKPNCDLVDTIYLCCLLESSEFSSSSWFARTHFPLSADRLIATVP
jgi:type I restriction enzyme S subunit